MPGGQFSFVLPKSEEAVYVAFPTRKPGLQHDGDRWSRKHIRIGNASRPSPALPSKVFCYLKVQDSRIWFETQVPSNVVHFPMYPMLFMRGESITRDQQEFWQATVRQTMESDGQTSE